jgi:ferredoxin
LLKAQANTVRIRLDRLNRHIQRMERAKRIPFHVAVVDTEKCLGCGICAHQCPEGAIRLRLKEIADRP